MNLSIVLENFVFFSSFVSTKTKKMERSREKARFTRAKSVRIAAQREKQQADQESEHKKEMNQILEARRISHADLPSLFLLSFWAKYAWAESVFVCQYYVPKSSEEEKDLRKAMSGEDGYGLWMEDGHGYEGDDSLEVSVVEVDDTDFKSRLIPILDELAQSNVFGSSNFGVSAQESRQ